MAETGEIPIAVTVRGTEWSKSAKGLAAKLSEVLGEIKRVPKRGRNKIQSYDFVTESDLADFVRPLLAERKVFLHQSMVDHDMHDLYKTQSGNIMYLTIVTVDFTWVDGETGETLPPQRFMGYGADTGDKGLPKALTAATKYALMKTFLISTGDDPESDERVDRAVPANGDSGQPRVSRRAPSGTQQRGGRSTVPTQPQITELRRLAGEAKLTPENYVKLIGSTLGVDVSDVDTSKPADIRNFVQRLSSEQVGRLITLLASPSDDTPGSADAEDVSDASDTADPVRDGRELGSDYGF